MLRHVSLLVLVGASVISAQPSVTIPDLLERYEQLIRTGHRDGMVAPFDLDTARSELGRLAPSFLAPLEGQIAGRKGLCPTVAFKVAGTTVTTDDLTAYDDGTCAAIANGEGARVFRRADASRPVARIVVPLPARATTSKPSADEFRRRLLASFALDLAESGSSRHAAAASRLVEWACGLLRSTPSSTGNSDFDHAWQLAALTLLEGAINPPPLEAHLGHVQSLFPNEPRFVLARAIVEEQSTAPAETIAGQALAVDAQRATYLLARSNAEHTRAAERAIVLFRDATANASIEPEAYLRLAHVELGLDRYSDAQASLSKIDHAAPDRALVYLSDLFRGLAFEGLDRPGDARLSYERALELSPGAHSATMRLAALAFRNGGREEADQLVAKLLADDDPQRDPWWSYYAADWRFWYPRIDRVHALLRGSAGPAPERAALPVPADLPRRSPAGVRAPAATRVAWQGQVFRSRVDAVTIPVAVKTGNRAVAGLTTDDFELRDNNVLQDISSVSVEKVPLDLTLLLDLSSSVDGATLLRLKTAIRDTAGLLRADDRVRLITISHALRQVFGLQPPSHDLPLADLSAEGATSLYDGLVAAMIHPTDLGRRQLVLAFTDGRDSTSIIDAATARTLARLTDAVVDVVVPVGSQNVPLTGQAPRPILDPRSGGIVTGTTGYTAPMVSGSDAAPAVLNDLVAPTSGQVFTFTASESISQAFKRMLDDFRATYVLQYVPQGVAAEGWHEVTVRLKKPGRFDVRARRGYSGGSFDQPVFLGPKKHGG